MSNVAFLYAAIAVLFVEINCQFGFGSFNQNTPQKQQGGFNFPQSDFVFPNFYPQPPSFGFNSRPQQRPNAFDQPRPQNTFNQPANFGGRPKPTFAMKFTPATPRTTPITFAPQLETGGNLPFRLDDERISQTSIY